MLLNGQKTSDKQKKEISFLEQIIKGSEQAESLLTSFDKWRERQFSDFFGEYQHWQQKLLSGKLHMSKPTDKEEQETRELATHWQKNDTSKGDNLSDEEEWSQSIMTTGQVRLHDNEQSHLIAKLLHAKAFTFGKDIFFGKDMFSPYTDEGDRLIKHELLHTGQQTQKGTNIIQRDHKEEETYVLFSRLFHGKKIFQAIIEGKKILALGSKGSEVEMVQIALMHLGYSLPVFGPDGKFGEETKNALRQFQIDSGLTGRDADGVLGKETLRLLDMRYSVGEDSYDLAPIDRATHYIFKIPVSRTYSESEEDKKALLIITLQIQFKISEREALILIDGGWHWTYYGGVTEAELNKGYTLVTVSVEEYNEITGGNAKITKDYQTDYTWEESRFKSVFADLGTFETQELRDLMTEINALENKYKISGEETTKERLDELRDIVAEMVDDIIEKNQLSDMVKKWETYFQRFAANIALEMLQENIGRAGVEKVRYSNSKDLIGVRNELEELNTLYQKADAYFRNSDLYTADMRPRKSDTDNPFERVEAHKNYFRIHRPGKDDQNLLLFYETEQEAFKKLSEATQKYGILAHPELELRDKVEGYVKMDDPALLNLLTEKASKSQDYAKQTQEMIAEDSSKIWSLPPVVMRTKQELGIVNGSIQDLLIERAIKEYEDAAFWKNMGMAALGIGLGLLALVSGPVGWVALAGSVGVGAYDAYVTYQDISFGRAAYGSSINPAESLVQDNPSWIWFVISVASIGLDVFDVFKLLKPVAKSGALDEALALFKTQRDQLAKLLDEGAELTAEQAEQLDQYNKLIKLFEDKAFATTAHLFVRLADQPGIALRLVDKLNDPKIAEAFVSLRKLVDDELYLHIARFYGGVLGGDIISQLPDVLKLVQEGGLQKYPELMREIFSQPGVQKVMLDNSKEPDLILKEYKNWQKAQVRTTNPILASTTFRKYLGYLGYKTQVSGRSLSLAEEFGKSFHSFDHLAKNRQLLRKVEDRFLTAYTNGQLPAKLQSKLDELLKTDLIGTTQDLERARLKVIDVINEAIGDSVDDYAEYQKVIDLLDQPGSRGALGEAFALGRRLLPGMEGGFRKVSVELGETGLPEFANRSRIILDHFLPSKKAILEIKTGGSFELDQLLKYDDLYKQRALIRDELIEAGIENGEIRKIMYLVLPGPTTVKNVTDPVKHATNIWREMQNLGMFYGDVFVLDRNGVMWQIVAGKPTKLK